MYLVACWITILLMAHKLLMFITSATEFTSSLIKAIAPPTWISSSGWLHHLSGCWSQNPDRHLLFPKSSCNGISLSVFLSLESIVPLCPLLLLWYIISRSSSFSFVSVGFSDWCPRIQVIFMTFQLILLVYSLKPFSTLPSHCSVLCLLLPPIWFHYKTLKSLSFWNYSGFCLPQAWNNLSLDFTNSCEVLAEISLFYRVSYTVESYTTVLSFPVWPDMLYYNTTFIMSYNCLFT